LQTRYLADIENNCSSHKIPEKLNRPLSPGVLTLEERAQQSIKAPAVVGIHGSKLDAHSLTWGDATDDASRADFNVTG
jgi:hypothetical protein